MYSVRSASDSEDSLVEEVRQKRRRGKHDTSSSESDYRPHKKKVKKKKAKTGYARLIYMIIMILRKSDFNHMPARWQSCLRRCCGVYRSRTALTLSLGGSVLASVLNWVIER